MSTHHEIESVRNQFLAELESFPKTPQEIEQYRTKYLGRKGLVASLFTKMGTLPTKQRPAFGKALNELKEDLTAQFDLKESGSSF